MANNISDKLGALSKLTEYEVDALQKTNYVKYIYNRIEGQRSGMVHMVCGDEVSITDIVNSVSAIVYTVYTGIKMDPEQDGTAEWFKNRIIETISADEFWDDDGESMSVTTYEEAESGSIRS